LLSYFTTYISRVDLNALLPKFVSYEETTLFITFDLLKPTSMRPFLTLAALIVSLTWYSCKSATKLYDEGQFERAFYSAVDDLKRNPSNTSARKVLPDAYEQYSNQLLNNISVSRSGTQTSDKIDRIYGSYNALQKMYNAVNSSPVLRGLIDPVDYGNDLSNAAEQGASFHYDRGQNLMSLGDKKSAQKAYLDFKITDSYLPGYKNVSQLKEEAFNAAITNVVVNNMQQQFGNYSINGAFFETDILNNLNSTGRNYYYIFYRLSEAQFKQVRVDQFMDIMMYDIWFGNLATNIYTYDVSKTINEPVPDTKETRSVTVNATVRVTRRIVDSRAAMDCRISDAQSRRIMFTERFPGSYTWEKLTGSYTGDARALSDKDRAIINGVYNNPPDYNDLYRELTRQIMNNFSNRMRQLYGR
jgi:hypothetical protein